MGCCKLQQPPAGEQDNFINDCWEHRNDITLTFACEHSPTFTYGDDFCR